MRALPPLPPAAPSAPLDAHSNNREYSRTNLSGTNCGTNVPVPGLHHDRWTRITPSSAISTFDAFVEKLGEQTFPAMSLDENFWFQLTIHRGRVQEIDPNPSFFVPSFPVSLLIAPISSRSASCSYSYPVSLPCLFCALFQLHLFLPAFSVLSPPTISSVQLHLPLSSSALAMWVLSK